MHLIANGYDITSGDGLHFQIRDPTGTIKDVRGDSALYGNTGKADAIAYAMSLPAAKDGSKEVAKHSRKSRKKKL